MASEVIIPVGFSQVVCKVRQTSKTNPTTFTFGVRNPDVDNIASLMAPAITGKLVTTSDGPMAPTNRTVSSVYLSTTVINGPETSAVQFEHIINSVGVVADSAGLVTQSETWVVSKKTSLRGRKFQGRMYVPMLSVFDTSVDTRGNILAAVVTANQVFWTNFLTNLESIQCPMHILHHDALTAPTPVTQLIVKAKIGTQRRRLRN